MNEKVKKSNEYTRPKSEMTVNKKSRRPEMARYQPPNSRISSNQNPSDNSAAPKPSTVKQTTEPIAETSPKTASIEKAPKASSGGLLKLNPNTINEIINQNEKLTLNEKRDEVCTSKNSERERHLVVRSSHSDRLQSNESRTLFDPNNPDKPILVDLKSRHQPPRQDLKKPLVEAKK
jgi:hypothetical protein